MTTKLNPGKPDGEEQNNQPALNTDRDIWRAAPGDYYADRLFITEGDGLGIDVGGHCVVRPAREWHKLAYKDDPAPSPQPSAEATEPIKVAGPYSIGSPHWNGLSKLIEECGEVSQVCGKIIGAGGTPDHWDGTHLPSRLEEELADLMAAAQYVIRRNGLSMFKIDERVMKKLDLFDTWNGANNGKL